MALLRVEGIGTEQGEMVSLKGISFEQQRLEKLGIAGETGSGKTTLLKVIAGLLQPAAGAVYYEDKRILGPDEQLIAGHKSIAYLSQYFELRNNYRVHELLQYANLLPQQKAAEVYAVCRIEHLLQRRTNQLSGGERQRVALARLLTTAPGLLVLDEPFSNLDLGHKALMRTVLEDITGQLGITCIMTSHDAADILSRADTILVMRNGQLVQRGTPEQVYHQPCDEYCAALFGAYNIAEGELAAALQPAAAAGKRMLIRPEHISLNIPGSGNACGMVTKVEFCGSYYMLHAAVMGQTIKVNSGTRKYAAGDTVCLSVQPQDFWYL